jgi:uncharacterized integral membrane protein
MKINDHPENNPRYLLIWEKIENIAKTTDNVGKMIYAPFIILLLMIVSRHPIFDHWGWPIPLILVILLSITGALYAAFMLRRTAEKFRRDVLRTLEDDYVETKLKEGDSKDANTIHFLITRIQSLNQGAFSSLSKNPILRAVLIPFGGVGALSLIDLFAKYQSNGF